MTRPRLAAIVSWVSACGFFLTAGLHGSAYGQIMRRAETAPETARGILAVLWLSAAVDLVIFGLVILAMARSSGTVAAAVIALAAVSPLAVAAMQVAFLGFVPPTAILLALGALTLWAAALKKGE